MTDSPKYTIAIPAFKGQYLRQCISSVLKQTFADFELIIINDCSPDPIDEVVATFSDERIHYHKNEVNRGAEYVVDNWNRCLSLAKGQYFVLLGDDDFVEINYLQEFDKLICDFPSLEVYHCRTRIVDEHGQAKELTAPWPSFEHVYDNIYYRLNMSRIHFISDFVYRAAGLKERKGFYHLPLAWGSDDITAFGACAIGGIAHTNQILLNYRESNHTITRSGSAVLKMEAVAQQQIWLENFLHKPPLNPDQLLVYKRILKELNNFMLRKRADIMKTSLAASGIKEFFFWLKQAKKYHIPRQLILKVFLLIKREKPT